MTNKKAPPVRTPSTVDKYYSQCKDSVTAANVVTGIFCLINFIYTVKKFQDAPFYASAGLLWVTLFNLGGALPHWLLPESGLEVIAGIDLGDEKSPLRTVAVFLLSEEGINRMYISLILSFISVQLPELAFQMIMFNMVYLIMLEFTVRYMKNLMYAGESLAPNAPGQKKFIISMIPNLLTVIVGLKRRDFSLFGKYFMSEKATEALVTAEDLPWFIGDDIFTMTDLIAKVGLLCMVLKIASNIKKVYFDHENPKVD